MVLLQLLSKSQAIKGVIPASSKPKSRPRQPLKNDNDLYKLFRRIIMLMFIIFEIVAQAYLVSIFYSFKDKLSNYINNKYLYLKIALVSILIIVAIISVPIISLPGNDFLGFNLKFFKHGLEWNYFIGVILFYLFTFLMWKKNN